MQKSKYRRCECGGLTLHVSESTHSVPHREHLLAIIALAIVLHPVAGMLWGVVWAVHSAWQGFDHKWTCTECGKINRDYQR